MSKDATGENMMEMMSEARGYSPAARGVRRTCQEGEGAAQAIPWSEVEVPRSAPNNSSSDGKCEEGEVSISHTPERSGAAIG